VNYHTDSTEATEVAVVLLSLLLRCQLELLSDLSGDITEKNSTLVQIEIAPKVKSIYMHIYLAETHYILTTFITIYFTYNLQVLTKYVP